MVSQLVLLSDSFPGDDAPFTHELNETLSVTLDADKSADFNKIIAIPRLKAKELAKYLAVNLNRGEKAIDFSGLTIVADTSCDDTTMAVLDRLAKVNLVVLTDYEPIFSSTLDVVDDQWNADIDDLRYWLENKKIKPEVGTQEQVEGQLDDLLADLDLDVADDSASMVDDVADEIVDRSVERVSERPEPVVEKKTATPPALEVTAKREEKRETPSMAKTRVIPVVEEESQYVVRADSATKREPEPVKNDDDLSIDYKRIEREREDARARVDIVDDDDDDELFDPMADDDEIEAIEIKQSDVLDRRDRDENVAIDAYIDTTLDDEERDFGTRNARASEPVMTNHGTPAFLERKQREEEESRRVVERLVPDPSEFETDEFELTVEDLMQNDGGFPKEEAPSAAQDTSKLTRNVSAEEGATTALTSHDDDDDDDDVVSMLTSRDLFDKSELVDTPKRDKIAFSATQLTSHDSFDALKSMRHKSTRIGGLTGPSGGSGKTTTAYCLFLASSIIDRSFSRQRAEQWTWLIEMDYQNPKWKHRTSIPGERTMLEVINEVNKRHGGISDAELIDIAKRHSVQILGSNHERSRLLAAPELNDYSKSDISKQQFLVVAERLISALSRNEDEPSTVILDLPDYSGENLDQSLSDIVNRYCDNVSVCFPDDGDIADLHSIIELLKSQRQNKVSTQRISVVGTRMNNAQSENLKRVVRDMLINYAGRIPLFPEIRRQSGNSEEVTERKTWIGNADNTTKRNATFAGARILEETQLNKLAKPYREQMQKIQMQKNPARKDNENRATSSGKKKTKKKNGSVLKSLFGIK